MRANFDEADLGKLHEGAAVEIRWEGKPGRIWHGFARHASLAAVSGGVGPADQMETELDLNLVRRQLLAIRLQQLQVDDETAVVRQRLSALMGTDASTFVPVSGSIPAVDTEHLAQVAEPASVAERSAAANAQSREQRADGDEQNARLKLRQKSLDVLDARFQMRKAHVSMLRLTDGLEPWLQGASVLSESPVHQIAPAAHPMP